MRVAGLTLTETEYKAIVDRVMNRLTQRMMSESIKLNADYREQIRQEFKDKLKSFQEEVAMSIMLQMKQEFDKLRNQIQILVKEEIKSREKNKAIAEAKEIMEAEKRHDDIMADIERDEH
jgi:hypothetical protein